jgi:hypothetical protein
MPKKAGHTSNRRILWNVAKVDYGSRTSPYVGGVGSTEWGLLKDVQMEQYVLGKLSCLPNKSHWIGKCSLCGYSRNGPGASELSWTTREDLVGSYCL